MRDSLSKKRLKFCDRLIMGQSPDGTSVSSNGDGIWFLQGNADFGDLHPSPKTRTTRPEKVCRTGDILLSVRAPVGAVNIADQDYAIGRGLCAIRPLRHDRRFLRYLLTTQADELNSIATGTTFTAVSVQQVGNLRVAAPSPTEQQRIAAYLDDATGKIVRLMSLRRRQMDLLREQRAAVIQQAVTRGLNSGTPLKESGLRWLGQIPKHWKVERIKYAARVESGHTPSRSVEAYWQNCDIPWVSLNDSGYLREHDYIHDTAYRINALGIANSSAHVLPARAVVFSRDATVGLCAITSVPMAVAQHFIAYLCGPELIPEYLLFVLRSMTQELEKLSMGATIRTIGMDDVRNLATPIAPVEEQKEILAFIQRETAKLDSLQRSYERQLALLAEYRASLIHECVNGQRALSNSSLCQNSTTN
jgi:type I restriction enzyme, S subunit